jgi:hypothetical protein
LWSEMMHTNHLAEGHTKNSINWRLRHWKCTFNLGCICFLYLKHIFEKFKNSEQKFHANIHSMCAWPSFMIKQCFSALCIKK